MRLFVYEGKEIDSALREVLTTFRLAGVDAQVIMRVLKEFALAYYERCGENNRFVSSEEAYDFAYLLLVLHTCQHNPSVKAKTDYAAFKESAAGVCPKSEGVTEEYLKVVFESITNESFYTPLKRSPQEEPFSECKFIVSLILTDSLIEL